MMNVNKTELNCTFNTLLHYMRIKMIDVRKIKFKEGNNKSKAYTINVS